MLSSPATPSVSLFLIHPGRGPRHQRDFTAARAVPVRSPHRVLRLAGSSGTVLASRLRGPAAIPRSFSLVPGLLKPMSCRAVRLDEITPDRPWRSFRCYGGGRRARFAGSSSSAETAWMKQPSGMAGRDRCAPLPCSLRRSSGGDRADPTSSIPPDDPRLIGVWEEASPRPLLQASASPWAPRRRGPSCRVSVPLASRG